MPRLVWQAQNFFQSVIFVMVFQNFAQNPRTSMKSLLTLELLAYHWRVHVILYYVYCIFV